MGGDMYSGYVHCFLNSIERFFINMHPYKFLILVFLRLHVGL